MKTTSRRFQLTSRQLDRANTALPAAIEFVSRAGDSLSEARIRHSRRNGTARDVITALARYQNDDGGFGQNLEVDIKSPASNAFAARLAMLIVCELEPVPDDGSLLSRLQAWLVTNQHEDGDWHFSPEIYKAPLPFWFQAWPFPAFNPSGCVVGSATRLGIATDTMRHRVASIYEEQGRAKIPDGLGEHDFYPLLPYIEYLPAMEPADRATSAPALANAISARSNAGLYEDAAHFFDHALGHPDVTRGIPHDVLSANVDRALDEQQPDGGWPSPYDSGWRPSITANILVALARLHDGVA